MAGFLLNYTFKDNAYLDQQESGDFKFWLGQGLPDYEGPLEGWVESYSKHAQELIDRGILRKS